MASLREIRKRLHSAENIKQITKAMEMVAAARLRRAQIKAEQAKPYASKLQEILNHLDYVNIDHPLFQERSVKKIGVIIVAADKGLCGSYNTSIFSAADKFLKKYPVDQIELILVGRKAIEHYKRRPYKIRHSITDWGEKFSYVQVKNLAYLLMNWFLKGELDQIHLIYTQYINILSRKVQVEKFLNLESLNEKQQDLSAPYYLYEPSVEAIYDKLVFRYCLTKIQTVFFEAYAAELSARVMSMRTASKNADEMIEKLTLTRNKVRQANITREMLEITAGAEGLK